MPYEQQVWLDGPDGHTPISSDRLNHMEIGIETAVTEAESAIPLAQKGVPNGVPNLDLTGFIPDNQIPAGITRDSELASALAALVNAAPGLLNTLKELADAIADDPNFATTITNLIATKAAATDLATEITNRASQDVKVTGSAMSFAMVFGG